MVSVTPPDPAQVLTVLALTQRIRGKLEAAFSSVWVSGEISNLSRAGSGHVYFSLKDEGATIGAALFRGVGMRIRFELRDGMQVLVNGRLTVYPPQGKYQLQIEQIIPKGIGPLELAFQQLRDKLQAKGYFDPRRKKKLPAFPQAIALVTSPTGAAIRDMLELLSRRWPVASVLVVPVRVQGDGAAQEIAIAIRNLNRLQSEGKIRLDAMIVGRGGGSLEDLWAFNEEVVANAVFTSKIPVVSAVGHEVDVTICDHVADHRALTPSHGVTDLTPDRATLITSLRDLGKRLRDRVSRRIDVCRQCVDGIAQRRIMRSPLDRIRDLEERLDEVEDRLHRSAAACLDRSRVRLGAVAGRLESLSPLNVLSRGYSLTRTPDGYVIRDADMIRRGDMLVTRLAKGSIISRAEEIQSEKEATP
jgi:exodeoxyribonuclease VII large subunit